MEQTEFNLLREPWIRVMRPDCGVEELSLTEVLLHAEDYRALAGELPTQDVAVLRLLLAVLHTVFSRVDASGNAAPLEEPEEALDRWQALWELGHLPEKPIRDYLTRCEDRFWLFHPDRPFYQVPEAEKGTEYSAAKLNGELSESSHKVRLFATRSGESKNGLSFAEAARWLLYVNGYDDTSSKPKEKGLASPGAGWLGKLGLLYADGSNLFETLLLNLVLLRDGSECWEAERPVWEWDKPRTGERTRIVMPNNQAELLTLQSRRLMLKRCGDCVEGFALLGGDSFDKENAFAEQMTVWMRVKGKGNEPPYDQPRRHDPSRQMWRDFAIITGKADQSRAPGITSWVSLMKRVGALAAKKTVTFKIASVQYGDKDFFVADVFGDHLDFHTDLLSEEAADWVTLIQRQITKCEEAANIVGRLAEGLGKAAGGDRNSDATYAREQFFYRIDIPFRAWLLQLDPAQGGDEDIREQAEDDMRREAYNIAYRLGKELVDQAGENAFVGRTIKEKIKGQDKEVLYSSAKVFMRFDREIGQCFDIKFDTQQEDKGGIA